LNLEQLERQVLLWNRAAILAPIFFTALLAAVFLTGVCDLRTLFFIACGLYFTTAVIWWWWTMRSVQMLIKVLVNTDVGIREVSAELKSIRKELQVDNANNK
tara:strand:+ start:1103 stop:1408 length:306 start_codon:yes stop_codon:yes gene_type:complete